MKKIILLASLAFSINAFAQIPNYVPTNGLVGWWPFNGNAIDESVNTNDGTVNGATLTADRFGNVNSAYSFDGVNDFIKCLNAGPTGNPKLTVSFWMKTTSSNYGSLFGYGDNGTNGRDFRIYFNSGHCSEGSMSFDTYNSAITHTVSQSNSWGFYVVIYDGTIGNTANIAKIYKNGVLMNSVCFTQNFSSTNVSSLNPITFGRYHGTIQTGFYNGLLDDIGLWNRVLTQQEITDLYNANICYQHITVTDTLIINTNLVGFNPITYQNTIKIFPNPTNDHITIDNGNIANLTGYQIKITNSLSQQVFQSAITQQQFYVDLSTWTGNGIYFVHIIDGQGNTIDIKKIVLQ